MSRIDELLAAMTLDEKIGQLTMVNAGMAVTGPVVTGGGTEAVRRGRIGSFLNLWGAETVHVTQRIAVEESRLRIPLFFAFDVIHGHRTTFPIPLAEAAAFDPDLWEETARAAAIEAAGDGLSIVFSPMIDVTRDPRWGRIAEGAGEDPWVTARLAEAKLRGLHGADLSAGDTVAAVAKHFCAYGAPTAGREYTSADVSERALHEVYLPPFAAAVAAGVVAIMPAFNDLAGVPMTANAPLLRGLLRQELGFDGVIISDYNAVAELINHGVAGDVAEAAALAIKAGVDIDMVARAYERGLPSAIERGLVEVTLIEEAVRRVLVLKERLGLFDDPYRRGIAGGAPGHEQRRVLGREIARRAIVLLTNAHDLLPIAEEIRRIAVVGPLAEANMLGPWAGAGRAEEAVTILEGLRSALANRDIVRAEGVSAGGDDVSGLAAAIDLCRSADLIILAVGETAAMSGEAASRADPGLPGRQRELCEAVLALSKPTVAILSCGRPLMVPWLTDRASAVLVSWFLGLEAGHAIADVVTGRFNPTGRLPVTWPRHVGQVPIYFARRPSGRPAAPTDHYTSKYIDESVTPLFPFGHGLSYTRFTLANLRAEPAALRPDGKLDIAVEVTNAGARDGQATVFLFIRDPVASVARPVLELRSFARIRLAAGACETMRWVLAASDLAFLGPDLKPRLEPGEFDIFAGESADPDRLISAKIRLTI